VGVALAGVKLAVTGGEDGAADVIGVPLGVNEPDVVADGDMDGGVAPHAASPAATDAAPMARSRARREMAISVVTPERYRFSATGPLSERAARVARGGIA
jgi:hypothetical protein